MCERVFSLNNRNLRCFATLLAAAFLASCATSRPLVDLPDLSNWELRRQVLSSVQNWSFKGRIAVKSGDDGFNAKFNWTQSGDDFEATVSGPLGIGTVRIRGDAAAIVVTDNDGIETLLANPEADLYIRYGWTIPVTSLRYWALGIPDPSGQAETVIDDRGRMLRLERDGWSLLISRYKESAGQEMPRTLTATSPETRVRMVIDNWQFFED